MAYLAFLTVTAVAAVLFQRARSSMIAAIVLRSGAGRYSVAASREPRGSSTASSRDLFGRR